VAAIPAVGEVAAVLDVMLGVVTVEEEGDEIGATSEETRRHSSCRCSTVGSTYAPPGSGVSALRRRSSTAASTKHPVALLLLPDRPVLLPPRRRPRYWRHKARYRSTHDEGLLIVVSAASGEMVASGADAPVLRKEEVEKEEGVVELVDMVVVG
jgi:hypothetical protein